MSTKPAYIQVKKFDKFLNKTDDHSQNHGNGIENKYALHFIIAFNGTKEQDQFENQLQNILMTEVQDNNFQQHMIRNKVLVYQLTGT